MSTTSLLLAALALTLAASVHCAGMCGPLVLAAGGAPGTRRDRFGSCLALQAGKTATYLFLGALAGVAGLKIVESPLLGWLAPALVPAAGIALVLAGLSLLGLRAGGSAPGFCGSLWPRLVGPILKGRPPGTPLFVGMAMGLLPCPLTAAGLVTALASGTPMRGVAVMAGMALGTFPALALVAARGAVGGDTLRPRLSRAAGVVLSLAGLAVAASALG